MGVEEVVVIMGAVVVVEVMGVAITTTKITTTIMKIMATRGMRSQRSRRVYQDPKSTNPYVIDVV